MIDKIEYAACFVRKRVGFNVNQGRILIKSLANAWQSSGSTFTEEFYNFTPCDIEIVRADGRRLIIKPYKECSMRVDFHIRDVVDKFRNTFVVFNHCRGNYDVIDTSLKMKSVSGENIDYHSNHVHVAKNRTDAHGDTMAVYNSISLHEFERYPKGIPIPDLMITVGLHKEGYRVINKVAQAFPNKDDGAIATGVRIVANIAKTHIKEFFVVMGVHKFTVSPRYSPDADNIVHFIKTREDGEEEVMESIHVDELLKRSDETMAVFKTSHDADEYVEEIKTIRKNFGKVKEERDKFEKENSDLKEKLKQKEAELANEKNATKQAKTNNSTSIWTKAAAIVTGIIGFVSSCIAVVLKFF